jgi:hypothetical protein
MTHGNDHPARGPRLDEELDRLVDESLRRVLAPPGPERFRAIAGAALSRAGSTPIAAHRRTGPGRWLAAAAALALAAAGIWLMARTFTSPPQDLSTASAWTTMAAHYRQKVADGFRPDVECRDQDEFESWFKGQFGQGLRMREPPEGMRAVGLAYSNTLSPHTISVLLEVDGAKVIVFVDLARRPAAAEGDPFEGIAESGLHVHSASAGDLVLYEVSPFDVGRAVSTMYNPSGGDGARSPRG